ncbi:pyridoxamine 5'-phosphate oxidase family protein [Salinicoccus albus]|uniref:pyridoxamine 5'-phosphate oxidase family protein n=1 Tax=Salinicoccus albus TaxID=418756 RepID=UPI00035CE5D8|nr:pyridoxamine 5'-phosphate oxidase family protein [Salinicoccus albus]
MAEQHGERWLQEKYGTMKQAAAFYNNQMLDHVNDVMINFIAGQDMMFISTADSKGECDASFRAGMPGFVRVIDEKTLIYPEYKGNGVMASLGNITENPHIGLMFIDFTENQIGLHVNGKASIIENDQLALSDIPEAVREEMKTEEGSKALRWVVIEVEEAYIHCSKHIPKLKKLDRSIHWGTDNEKQKGGDFFNAKHSKKD